MARTRAENYRSVFVLLFLNVAFFLLEYQDPQKYARMFAFDRDAVAGGEVWRLVTYQFTQAGKGWMEALSLFITLLLLYMMGSALEEEWGTFHFAALFTISTLGSAAVAAFLDIPLLGTYFVYFTLLFVYAATFPLQTFYLFGMIPVRVRLLAFFSLAVLVYGVYSGGAANIAALAGAAFAYAYYLWKRAPARVAVTPSVAGNPQQPPRMDTKAIHTAARYAAIKQALSSRSDADIDRLIELCEREIVPDVNICPPADYKPDDHDGYCIRCEGFAECSARDMRLNRVQPAVASGAVSQPAAPHALTGNG